MWQAWGCVCIRTLSWDMCGVWVGALGGVCKCSKGVCAVWEVGTVS